MEFVEQERRDPVERRIVEDHAREDALGDKLDAGAARHLGTEAHAIADGLAHGLAQLIRHARSSGAGGQPARLQHDDFLAGGPRLASQDQRHARGLAGARRRHQYRGVVGQESGL